MSKSIYNYIEMMESLNSAAEKAGGGGYDVAQLKAMTALELVVVLATNDVRFTYTGPERAVERDIAQ